MSQKRRSNIANLPQVQGGSFSSSGSLNKVKPFQPDNKLLNREQGQPNNSKMPILVGVLVSQWKNASKKLMARNSGSAFAVTPSIILTCTHNVYVSVLKRPCDQLFFFPSPPSATELNQVEPIKAHFLQDEDYREISFDVHPIKEELQLLVLEKPLKVDFPLCKIGNFSRVHPEQNTLHIFGYPNPTNSLQDKPKGLQQISGQLVKVLEAEKECELQYKIHTVKGYSGSPVLCKAGQDWVVVGMHTHQGQNSKYNAGLYFTDQLLQKIKDIALKATLDHQEINNIFVKETQSEPQKQEKIGGGQELGGVKREEEGEVVKGEEQLQEKGELHYSGHNDSSSYENSPMMDEEESYSNKSEISIFDDMFVHDEEQPGPQSTIHRIRKHPLTE